MCYLWGIEMIWGKKVIGLLLIFVVTLSICGACPISRAEPSYEFNPYQVHSSNLAFFWAEELSPNVEHQINILQTVDLNNDLVPDVIAGTNYGVVALNGTNGSLLWANSLGSVTSIVIQDLDGDTFPEIILNGGLGRIYALNRTGGEIWQNGDFSAKEIIIITEQNNELIFGISTNRRVFCLNGTNGQEIWNTTFENTLNELEAVDLNNDGVEEGLIACYNKLCVINVTNGYIFWNFSAQRQINAIDTGRVNASSLVDVFIGSDDNKVYAINGTNGQEIWNYPHFTDIVALKAMDTDNDTITDLIPFACWDSYSERYLRYLNATSGTIFTEQVDLSDVHIYGGCIPYNPVGIVHDMACGDIDGDGYENDLVVSTEHYKMFVIKELGTVLWQRTVQEAFTDIILTDLNNDSKDDVIIGTLQGSIYAIDSNNATLPNLGSFTPENYLTTSHYWSSECTSAPFNNKEYSIYLIIRNLGKVDSLEFNYSIYLDEVTSENLLFEREFMLTPSYTGAGGHDYIDWFISFDLTGSHKLIIVIDSSNEIAESDESNNQIEIQLQIQWNYYPLLGYLFLFFGIGILIIDIVIYQKKKGPKTPSQEVSNGGTL